MSLAPEGKGTAKRVGRPQVNALGSAVLTEDVPESHLGAGQTHKVNGSLVN